MTAHRFTQIASIVFGIFALYTAIWAIPTALWYPRNLASDIVRFGFILASMIFGLALLFPHRFIPALRREAEHSTPDPLRFLCALMMCVCLFVAMLSGTVSIWLRFPIVAGFIVAFVYPGLVYRNISIIPSENIDISELAELAGEKTRKGPKFNRRLQLAILILLILGPAWAVFSKQTIPNPLWALLSGWIAIFGAVFMTAVIFRTILQVLPKSARRGSLVEMTLWVTVIFGISVWGNRAILLNLIPTDAAYFWGESIAQNSIVVKSKPRESRKGCYGSVDIRIATDEIEICNISRDFLEKLSQGDTLVIIGRATRFGQTIDRFMFYKN